MKINIKKLLKVAGVITAILLLVPTKCFLSTLLKPLKASSCGKGQ